MKKNSLYFVLILAGLIFIDGTYASAQTDMKKKVLWSAEDIKWEHLQGAPPDVMNANLWGNSTKGAYGGFTKFPAGFKAPLHYHTNDMKIVVVKGAYTYKGKEYGPGSYLFIPGGDRHESAGIADSETIFFTEQPGKFDVKPVGATKKK